MTNSEKKLFIGAHMSISGGVYNALYKAKEIGATTAQIFTSNQRQWKSKEISESDLKKWKIALAETQLQKISSHNSYLINLGSPDKILLKKSIDLFSQEIKRCHLLDIDFLTFHPGSATKNIPADKCLEIIVDSLLSIKEIANNGTTILLLETTAGQGSNVGHRFEHLANIIKKVSKDIPIGVCFDTCHSFAAGYDIRTKKAWDLTLREFDKIIGLKYLHAMHVNDSKHDLGSRKDRHAPLGKGKIGLDGFKFIMQDSRLKYLPKYLETPFGDKNFEDEIKLLFEFGEKK
jgi:deoxyribonuclease IV